MPMEMDGAIGITVKCEDCGEELKLYFGESVWCCGREYVANRMPETLRMALDAAKYKQ